MKPLHTLLPPEAIVALQRAYETDNPRPDPKARLKAIEAVTERLKLTYPNHFRKEPQS